MHKNTNMEKIQKKFNIGDLIHHLYAYNAIGVITDIGYINNIYPYYYVHWIYYSGENNKNTCIVSNTHKYSSGFLKKLE